jgi:hypothetical protein
MAKQEADWQTIDPDTLTAEAKGLYDAYKVMYRQMKEAREAFESRMAYEAALPAGYKLVFGYNFGKLSLAVVEGEVKQAKAKTGTKTLADFLALQSASSRRL